MAKPSKKISRIEAVEIASKKHKEVCRFLNRPTVRKKLPIVKTKDPPSEVVLLDRLLCADEPITSDDTMLQTIGTESTVNEATKRLNKLLEDFSNNFEVLKKSGVIITIPSHKGGLQVGHYFACQKINAGTYLHASEIRQVLSKAWDKFWEAQTRVGRPEIVERILKKKLETQAKSALFEKLHQRGLQDYQPLAMEVGLVKSSIEPIPSGLPVRAEEKCLDSHNRTWKNIDFIELLNPQHPYILSSDTGTGKTTFLRYIQLRIVEQNQFMPIFIHAADLQLRYLNDFDSFIHQLTKLLDLKLPDSHVKVFLKKNFQKIIWLIDGFDQIEGMGTDYGQLFSRLLKLFGRNLIIASRPFATVNLPNIVSIRFLRLKPFNKWAQEKYFGKYLERARELCVSCIELMAVPMLAYMVRTLIENNRDKGIKSRSGLYKHFIDYVLIEYTHDRIKSNVDVETGVRQTLAEISYEAIALRTPYIQKIPLSFCEKYTVRHNITVEKFLKYGLVTLIIEKTRGSDKFLYFSHQSFQEYLAAEWILQHEDLIEYVLKELWNPKLKELVKFLAGSMGENFIKHIYSPGCNDNCIHSRLFLASECCGELYKPVSVEKYLFNAIKNLAPNSTFEWDILKAISAFNIPKAKYYLLNLFLRNAIGGSGYFAGPMSSFRYLLGGTAYFQTKCFTDSQKILRRYFALCVRLLTKHEGNKYEQIAHIMANFPGHLTCEQISTLIDYECLNAAASYLDFSALCSEPCENLLEAHLRQIITLLKHPDEQVSARALGLLDKLFTYHSAHQQKIRCKFFEKVSPQMINAIIDLLTSSWMDFYKILNVLEIMRYKGLLCDNNISTFINSFKFFNPVKISRTIKLFLPELKQMHVKQIENMLKDNNPHIQEMALYAMAGITGKLSKKKLQKALFYLRSPDVHLQIASLAVLRNSGNDMALQHIDTVVDMVPTTSTNLLEAVLKTLAVLAQYLNPQQVNLIIASLTNNTLFTDIVISTEHGERYSIKLSHIPLPKEVTKSQSEKIFSFLRSNNGLMKKLGLILSYKGASFLDARTVEEISLLTVLRNTSPEIMSLASLVLVRCVNISPLCIETIIKNIEHQNPYIKKTLLSCLMMVHHKFTPTHADMLAQMVERIDEAFRPYVCKILIAVSDRLSSKYFAKIAGLRCRNSENCDRLWPVWVLSNKRRVLHEKFQKYSDAKQVQKAILSTFVPCFFARNYAREMTYIAGKYFTEAETQKFIDFLIQRGLSDQTMLALNNLPKRCIRQSFDKLVALLLSSSENVFVTRHMCSLLSKVPDAIKPEQVSRIIVLFQTKRGSAGIHYYYLLQSIYNSGKLPELVG